MAVLAVGGAFLARGPIGLGNGPVLVASYASESVPDNNRAPMAIILPVLSTSHDEAVIDSVELIGNAGNPAPRMFALRAMKPNFCLGMNPLRQSQRGLVPSGCQAQMLGPLAGQRIGYAPTRQQVDAVIEVGPPPPGSCWALSAVVVHYHVGIRHWSATGPGAEAACSGVSQDRLDQARNEAAGAAPR